MHLAKICHLGHNDDDGFAIKCMQEGIVSVSDFHSIEYEDLADVFDTFKVNRTDKPIRRGVQNRIRNAWLYSKDRFRPDGKAEKDSDIFNWDQDEFDQFTLDLNSYGIIRDDLFNSILKGNPKRSPSSSATAGGSTSVTPSPLTTKQQLEN